MGFSQVIISVDIDEAICNIPEDERLKSWDFSSLVAIFA